MMITCSVGPQVEMYCRCDGTSIIILKCYQSSETGEPQHTTYPILWATEEQVELWCACSATATKWQHVIGVRRGYTGSSSTQSQEKPIYHHCFRCSVIHCSQQGCHTGMISWVYTSTIIVYNLPTLIITVLCGNSEFSAIPDRIGPVLSTAHLFISL